MRHLLTMLLAGLFLAALPGVAQAQRSGHYAVQGSDAAGSTYTGSVELRPTGPETWRITWRIANETINGTGIAANGMLAVGYIHGRDMGVAIYKVMPDGSLAGRWTTGRNGGAASELWLPR
jgi:hypothetical protein